MKKKDIESISGSESLKEITFKIDFPIANYQSMQNELQKSIYEASKYLSSYQTNLQTIIPKISKEYSDLIKTSHISINQFAKEILELKRIFESYSSSLYKNISQIRNDFKSIFGNNIIHELGKAISQYENHTFRNIALVADMYRSQYKDISKLMNEVVPLYNTQLKDISRTFSDAVKYYQENYSESFGINILNSVGAISINDEPENLELILSKIETTIIEQCSKLPKSNNLYNTVLSLVIFILGLLYTHYSNKGTEKLIIDKIETSKNIILIEIEKIKPVLNSIKSDSIYVVLRSAKVYIKPNMKQYSSDLVYPNMMLRLIARKKRWIYVEYFDFIDGIPKYGWVLKKYCKLSFN